MSFRRIFAVLLAAISACLSLAPGAWAAPTVTVLSPAAGATVGTLTQVSVTFSETVAGVDASDLLINNDASGDVTGSGAGPYVFTFTQPAPGTVLVQFDSDHGIAGVGGSGLLTPPAPWTYTLTDTTAPVVAQQTPAAGSTAGSLSQTEIVFSETVTGVNAADLLINGVAATGMTGSGFGPYVFTFPTPPVGTVNFQWAAAHGIADTASPANPFTGGSWAVTRSAAGVGNLVITEFLAANVTGLADENAERQDWIEIYNAGAGTVSLAGWALTNDDESLDRWTFPSWTLAAGNYVVVFASGKNRKPAQAVAGQDNPGTLAQPRLHTGFKLNQYGSYLALVGPESPRTAISHFSPEFPVQRNNYSYGIATGSVLRYFATPSPAAANGASTLTAITPKPDASVGRGFFKDPFSLVMSCQQSGATIRYTTDGSEPTTSTGTLYAGPLTISATTILRAAAFSENTIASETVTHSYLFLDQVLTQPDAPAGFPSTWGREGSTVFSPASSTPGVVPADYGMDPEIVNDPAYAQMLKDGLRALPVISIVTSNADMFAYSNDGNNFNDGIYSQPTIHGNERPGSVEMLLQNGKTAFTATCGIQIQGNASRTPSNNPKHAFKLEFKGDYGATSLDYQLFADSPVKKFDDIVLRSDYNTSWRHWDPTQRSYGTLIRDEWMKDSMRAMGGLAGHSSYVHLFVNGLYWGVYDPTEQPVGQFAANYLGGDKADYDVINEENVGNYTPFVKGGDATVYNAMVTFARSINTDFTVDANYETLKGYLDLRQFLDYMVLHFYAGHQDWGVGKNWYAIRKRAAGEGFRFIPWDGENILMGAGDNRVTNYDTPAGLHRTNTYRNAGGTITSGNLNRLRANAEYRFDFADRVHRHLIAPGGALTPAANIARWQKRQAEIDTATVAESARWGDYRRDVHLRGAAPLYTRNTSWLTEMSRIAGVSGYFAVRTNTLLTQFRNDTLYPTLNAAEFRNAANAAISNSNVPAGFPLTMALPSPPAGTTSAGTIYFTTDGTDPRVPYSGAVNMPGAQAYTAPVAINATTTVKARVLNGATWSALNEATFTVGVPASSVRIVEIMYNPPGGNAYEFLELQNTGARSVEMGGWSVSGVDYVFPFGTVLAPGGRMVLGNNDGKAALFAARYPGISVAGWFGGSLDNGGERIAILDASGSTVVSVDYDDEAGWPTPPDGGGYSLEIIDADGDPDSPVNWRPSNAIKGTPGLPNSTPPGTTVVINEVLADNAGVVAVGSGTDDYIELKNTGASAVDVVGWTVSAGSGNSFTFSGSTIIGPGGFLVLPCSPGATGARLPAALSAAGGFVQLKDSAGAQVDAIHYGCQLPNLGIGRVGASWVLTAVTVAASNTAAATAPAAGNLVLNEWLSDAVPGGSDWIELYNKHATLPVALQGLWFQTDTQLYRYPALSFIAPLGWLRLSANEQPGAMQLDFKLPASGTALTILDAAGVAIDAMSAANFGTPPQGVSRGRSPDGSGTFVTFAASASPGAANYLNTWSGPVLNEVLARNVTGALAPWSAFADWAELSNPTGGAFDLGGMKLGTSTDAAAAWTFPAGTSIPAGGRLAVWCDPAQAASAAAGGDMNTGLTLGDTSGGLYLFNAAGQLVNHVEWGFQIADKSIGLDSGVWKLLAAPTRGLANSAAHALGAAGQLRINEWMAVPVSGSDWFELYNPETEPVELTGLYLTDEPSETGRTKFAVTALSFIAGRGWVKWIASSTPSAGRDHVNFALDAGAEYLRLSSNDASLTLIDAVSFGAQTAGVSEGRIPDGAANITAMPGSPTPGAKNVLLPAPTITTDPLSQTVMTGANVSLIAAASGSAPLGYQWRFNGVDIPGATAATLALNGVTAANDGAYVCVATNTAGSATSATATLTVQFNFAQWATWKNLTGADALATADPDKDGLSNLREFFHNLNPQLAATAADRASLPVVALEPATGTPLYLTLTYRRNARAVLTAAEHQLSLTLAAGSWGTATPDVTEALAPDPVTGDPRFRVKFSIAPGETRKFLKLLLTQ